jgi:hypothetical protein
MNYFCTFVFIILIAMTTLQKFSNLMQLFDYFKTEQICRDYLEQIRWSNGYNVKSY